MTTIKDVAHEAGVSIATVSYVVNRNRRVNRETAEKVRQVIEKLNYRPNRAARALVTKSTKMIGVMVSNISNPFFAPIVRGIEDVATEQGYITLVGNSDESRAKTLRYIDVLSQHRIDGLIISPAAGSDDVYPSLEKQSIPLVIVNRQIEGMDTDLVENDNELGASKAVQHLCSLGHTRIGIVSGTPQVSTFAGRLAGYTKTLAEHLIRVDQQLIRTSGWDEESACRATRELLALKKRPTAVISASGILSTGVLRAIKEANVRMPDDISFVAFDETEWSSLVSPSITTVAQKTHEMGRAAGKILIRRIEERKAKADARGSEDELTEEPRQMVKLEPELIVRESTGRTAGSPQMRGADSKGERRDSV